MGKAPFLFILIISIFITSCGDSNQVHSEKIEGDYTLRTILDKDSFQSNEDIHWKAMLKYSGEKNQSEIHYIISPFTFVTKEKNEVYPERPNRAIKSRALKKNEWLEETYTLPIGYPSGKYQLVLTASFYDEESKVHNISTEVTITIK